MLAGQLIVDIDKLTADMSLGHIKHVFPCSEVDSQKMYPTWLLVTDVHVIKVIHVSLFPDSLLLVKPAQLVCLSSVCTFIVELYPHLSCSLSRAMLASRSTDLCQRSLCPCCLAASLDIHSQDFSQEEASRAALVCIPGSLLFEGRAPASCLLPPVSGLWSLVLSLESLKWPVPCIWTDRCFVGARGGCCQWQ
jgi:hypothetical protein